MRRLPPGLLFVFVVALAGCRSGNPGTTSAPGPTPVLSPSPAQSALAVVADSTTYTTGTYQDCAPEGDGGDPDLNRRKNRDMPPPAYQSMTLAEILANHPAAAEEAGRKDRESWPQEARDQIAEWERTGVQVEGYLLKAKREGPESCNCHADDQRDFHIWLAASPSDDRSNSVVVEVSPRVGSQHDTWTTSALNGLARDGTQVRISGWLMWDQEHPEQLGKTRGTLWEVHPIHKIEVDDGGQWREL